MMNRRWRIDCDETLEAAAYGNVKTLIWVFIVMIRFPGLVLIYGLAQINAFPLFRKC